MDTKQLEDFNKNLEEIKRQHELRMAQIELNPSKAMADMGIDPTKILNKDVLEKLKDLIPNLNSAAEGLEKIIDKDNPKSKGFQNYSKQKNQPGFDQEKLMKMFASFMADQQEKKAENCFHFDQLACKGGIIDAHSLQHKGPLNKIAEKEKNDLYVIHFKRALLERKWEASSIPIRTASTFRGFCHHHDDIFSAIEKETYTGSALQNFLHSNRSFAYSYHKVLEKNGFLNSMVDNVNPLIDTLGNIGDLFKGLGFEIPGLDDSFAKEVKPSEEQIKAAEAERFENHKLKLNEYLKKEAYDQLEYFTHELNHICPIVCSSRVKLHAETNRLYIIDSTEIYNGYPLMITTFHTAQNKTIILLARFKTDIASQIIFDQLQKLSNIDLEKRISNLIFEQVENFYLAPAFWGYLPQSEKDKIHQDINTEKEQFPYKSTFKASINIFDGMHKLTDTVQ